MAKKAKKRIHPMPKLGWQDRLLYTLLIIICFGGSVGCLAFSPIIFFISQILKSGNDSLSEAVPTEPAY